MDQILRSGNDIGDWENKEITNLNTVYTEAEKQLTLGYKMYNVGLFLETFVIFMRVTKLYGVVNKNLHLMQSNKRHLQLKISITKIVTIMELIEQYEKKLTTKIIKKKVLPAVPNNINSVSITISESTDKNTLLPEDEIMKANMVVDLQMRWNRLMPK